MFVSLTLEGGGGGGKWTVGIYRSSEMYFNN